MGAQSLVIGKMFGEGFQYGKRKISAMPNEEFNKLTFESMMSNAREEIKASVPTMNAAMQDMKPMVEIVVREFLQYINLVSKTLQEVTVTGIDQAAHLVGTHVGHPPAAPVVEPTPTGPNIQQPFQPYNPTPFTPLKPRHIHKGHGHKVKQKDVSIKGLPRAGQTQILERDKLIQAVAAASRLLSFAKTSGTKAKRRSELKAAQTKLTNLLKRYNWR